MPKKLLKTHASLFETKGSMVQKYQDVVVGQSGWGATLYFELCMWLGPVPGALGLALRKLFWPRMFHSCGKGTQFASGIVVRHPNRIKIGKNVIIAENCVLDGRNSEHEVALTVGDDVTLGNMVILSAKTGVVTIGNRTGISPQTFIQSTHNCPVVIGEDNLIGPLCHIIAGGNYNTDDINRTMFDQGLKLDTGCYLADNVWLGAQVTVLGGVTMAYGSIAAANATVTKDVAENNIVGGVPAKIIRVRT